MNSKMAQLLLKGVPAQPPKKTPIEVGGAPAASSQTSFAENALSSSIDKEALLMQY